MITYKDRFFRLCAECLADSEIHSPPALSSLDWDRFLETASRHSIGPLLYHNLKRSEKFMPPAVLEHLKKQYYLNAIRNDMLYKDLGTVLEAFRDAKIEAIVLKGAALAGTVYQDTGLRPFSDTDLLVRKEDINKAEEMLIGLGYVLDTYTTPRGFSERFDYHQRYIKGLSIVELHWDLGLRLGIYKYINIRMDAFWRDARKSKVAGLDALILSPENLIIHSCIHSAKHKYSKLIWLCDLWMIAERDRINWDYLTRNAKLSRTAKPIFYGLSLADELPGIVLPRYLLDELRPPSFEIRLFKFFICLKLYGVLGTAKDMVLRLLLIDRQIDRLKFLATYPVESLIYLLRGNKKRTLIRLKEGTVGL